MSNETQNLAARIRNLFSIGKITKRYDDGKIQVTNLTSRVVEAKEAFPYGFFAKAKEGKAFVLCQGGDFNGFEILPVIAAEAVELPELAEDDVALYAIRGGKIKLVCKDGKFWIANSQKDVCALLLELIDKIKAMKTAGSPAAHTVDPSSQTELETFKQEVKKLFAEAE